MSVEKEVKISPEVLSLKEGEGVEVTVANIGGRTLSYKLKTTRPSSVRPTKAFGVVKSGTNEKFKVNYKPSPTEKPFTDADRVTILVGAMTDSSAKPEHYWKTPNAVSDAYRHVLKLEKAGEGGKKGKGKKKEASEKEEEVKSEESEAETESGTESGMESGSEATKSGA